MHSMHIKMSLRITKGNNSRIELATIPCSFIMNIFLVYMNVFARFDEIYSMALQDIKEICTYKSH